MRAILSKFSGKLNRTAERYLEIIRQHGIEITESERTYLISICNIGFMVPYEISELPDEVRASAMALGCLYLSASGVVALAPSSRATI